MVFYFTIRSLPLRGLGAEREKDHDEQIEKGYEW
jgi:hypothetical protein